MLTRRKIPNTLDHCLNCGVPLQPEDVFCGRCGQKAHDGKIPLLKMFREFFTNHFNLDNRFVKTLLLLFIPGKLTNEYFAGKRQSQINPIRLFFAAALLALAVFQITNVDSVINLNNLMVLKDQNQALETLDSLQEVLNEREITEGDSIMAGLRKKMQIREDSFDLKSSDVTIFSDYFEKQVPGNFKLSNSDFFRSSPSELVKEKGLTGFSAIYFRQKIKLIKDPSSYIRYVAGNLAWIYLAYIPVLALVLKLLYIRRRRYYVEHLVFSLHMHTVFLLILVFSSWLVRFTGNAIWIPSIFLFALYLFLSMKFFYRQSIFRTLVKYTLLQLIYPIILLFCVAIGGLVSLIFF